MANNGIQFRTLHGFLVDTLLLSLWEVFFIVEFLAFILWHSTGMSISFSIIRNYYRELAKPGHIYVTCSLISRMDFKLQIFFFLCLFVIGDCLSIKCTHSFFVLRPQADECVSVSVCVTHTLVRFQITLHLIGAFASI